ncbi:hypothetical protein BJ912DRAFT_953148 [Pholiota molesta]|nr:hypothetical protein BJ912DRAFT_953148 [Pholiota molesta]
MVLRSHLVIARAARPYILVYPQTVRAKNLWGKIVLGAQWVRECRKTNQLQTFESNRAGCTVPGNETLYTTPRRKY